MAKKGTPEIQQDMFDALESYLSMQIAGLVYQKECRPFDSKAEDAVIAVSAAGSEQIQAGKAKINIYVPDIDNGSGHPVPDLDRIQNLSGIGETVIEILNAHDTDYEYELDGAPKDYINHENHQHFVNISIKFNRVTFNS